MLNINIDNIGYRKTILSRICLKIDGAGLYGFFGKNGAGKTTFFNALCGLIPFNGKVLYNDKKLETKSIAFIPTEPFIYEYITVEEFYNFHQHLVEGSKREKKIFDIDSNKLLKECSTGTRKKAYINTILQHQDYSIYIFDEPFNGLDIESNYIILNEILEIARHHIVLISSHIIEVIEEHLDGKFLVHNGSIEKIENHEFLKIHFLNGK